MSEKLEIGTIQTITDDDTGMYVIGEVDGGFKTALLKDHIEKHGVDGVIKRLAYMMATAISISKGSNVDDMAKCVVGDCAS